MRGSPTRLVPGHVRELLGMVSVSLKAGRRRTALAQRRGLLLTVLPTSEQAVQNLRDLVDLGLPADEIATWTETLYPTSGSGVTKTSSFTYAPDGAMASRTVDGLTTTYTHWRNGLEKTATPWGTAGTISSTWMPNASPNVVAQPGGVTTSYTYDPAARLSSKRVVRGGSGLSVWQQVTYDGDDNRTGELVSQAQPGGGTKMGTGTYAYDRLGRLVQAKHPLDATSAKTYVLDDAGNIINDGEAAYTYSHNRLTRAESVKPDSLGAGVSFSYDGHGNMTGQHPAGGGSTTFSYDGASQTTKQYQSSVFTFEDPFTGEIYTELTSEDTVRTAYDAIGRLVRRRETHWDWDMDGSPSNKEELFFFDRNTQQIALETTTTGTATVRYVLDSTGIPLGQHKDGAFGRYVTDLRTNLTQVLDGSGAVRSVYGYDPFGGDKPGLTSSSSGFDSRLRYQMAPRDPRTGVYALGPRLLDPAINRFVGADFYVAAAANMQLALDPLTGNRYLYAGANPAGYVDDGHWPCFNCWWNAAKRAVGGFVARYGATVVGIACAAGGAVCGVIGVAVWMIQTMAVLKKEGFTGDALRHVLFNSMVTLISALPGWSVGYMHKQWAIDRAWRYFMGLVGGSIGYVCSAARGCALKSQ